MYGEELFGTVDERRTLERETDRRSEPEDTTEDALIFLTVALICTPSLVGLGIAWLLS